MTILRKAAAVALVSAATLVTARALKPSATYCEVCGDETWARMVVIRSNEQPTRLGSITTSDPSVLAIVCPDCGWDVYQRIDTAVRDIIEQAQSALEPEDGPMSFTMGHVRTGKIDGAARVNAMLKKCQEEGAA